MTNHAPRLHKLDCKEERITILSDKSWKKSDDDHQVQRRQHQKDRDNQYCFDEKNLPPPSPSPVPAFIPSLHRTSTHVWQRLYDSVGIQNITNAVDENACSGHCETKHESSCTLRRNGEHSSGDNDTDYGDNNCRIAAQTRNERSVNRTTDDCRIKDQAAILDEHECQCANFRQSSTWGVGEDEEEEDEEEEEEEGAEANICPEAQSMLDPRGWRENNQPQQTQHTARYSNNNLSIFTFLATLLSSPFSSPSPSVTTRNDPLKTRRPHSSSAAESHGREWSTSLCAFQRSCDSSWACMACVLACWVTPFQWSLNTHYAGVLSFTGALAVFGLPWYFLQWSSFAYEKQIGALKADGLDPGTALSPLSPVHSQAAQSFAMMWLLRLICCLVLLSLGAWFRGRLRRMHGIKGDSFQDCLTYLCCPVCAVAQEAREIKCMDDIARAFE